jgi:hypothetical protein
LPTSRAYWELKAEQMMNRVFSPDAAIDLEPLSTDPDAPRTAPAPHRPLPPSAPPPAKAVHAPPGLPVAGAPPPRRASDLTVVLAAMLGGVGLVVPFTQQWAAWGLVALYVAVFPANINMAINQLGVGPGVFASDGGAYLVAVVLEGVDQGQWVNNLRNIVAITDVAQGMIKGVVFGFMVALIGCYQGFYATGGAAGVGKAVNDTVVLAATSFIVANYFLTTALFGVGP